MAKLSDIYGIASRPTARKVPVAKVRALETGPSRGPKPTPISAAESGNRTLMAFSFSLEPAMVYRLEERMRAEKRRNRSETLRYLLKIALE